MIICPNCKEEIDDDSRHCDQCGQALLFCAKCGRVGMGRRCTSCGGQMLTPDDLMSRKGNAASASVSSGFASHEFVSTNRNASSLSSSQRAFQTLPQLVLSNDTLNIRISGINGAVIGRRQGPYTMFFQQNMFVSGVHAQLKYISGTGWCVSDKHSSNGTWLNQRQLQPDMEMSLKSGDVLTIANINLQVSIQ